MSAMLTTAFLIMMLFTVIIYVVMVLRWWIAWQLSPDRILNTNSDHVIPVTVIVAVRNESRNIGTLLNCLLQQNYNSSLMEIIISDDFSEDDTMSIVTEILKQQEANHIPVRLITALSNDKSGKKAALQRGIEAAKGSLIITTDADCTMGLQWVSSFVKTFQFSGASLIVGFVTIDGRTHPLQALEFLSLSGTTAASLLTGKPLMCNGANLAFSKKAFQEAGGYNYGEQMPGGDDIYLMLSIMRMFGPGSISRNPFRESVVTTLAAGTVEEFVHQRTRWASKMKSYREKYIRASGVLIFLTNAFLSIALVGSLAGWISLSLTLVIWPLKGMVDGLLLWKGARFSHQEYLFYLILPATIFYPFYLTVTGIIIMARPHYRWKERDH